MDEWDEIDWDWDDHIEVDTMPWDKDMEDWAFEDEAGWISELLEESIQSDVLICLDCGEIVAHCGCD